MPCEHNRKLKCPGCGEILESVDYREDGLVEYGSYNPINDSYRNQDTSYDNGEITYYCPNDCGYESSDADDFIMECDEDEDDEDSEEVEKQDIPSIIESGISTPSNVLEDDESVFSDGDFKNQIRQQVTCKCGNRYLISETDRIEGNVECPRCGKPNDITIKRN